MARESGGAPDLTGGFRRNPDRAPFVSKSAVCFFPLPPGEGSREGEAFAAGRPLEPPRLEYRFGSLSKASAHPFAQK